MLRQTRLLGVVPSQHPSPAAPGLLAGGSPSVQKGVLPPGFGDLAKEFDLTPYLPHEGVGNLSNVFERMGPYKERVLMRSACILAYTIVAATKGYSYTDLLHDSCKEDDCQEVADRIEETCYAALRDGFLVPRLSPFECVL